MKKIKENKIILFLFLVSTLVFIFQRFSGGAHWDFTLYAANGKSLFSRGVYYEWWVSPLTPFILGLFSFAGDFLSEYIYIVFVSSLFLISCMKFSETFKIDRTLFYSTFINGYIIFYGIRNGTELLSLSFLMLFFAYFFKKSNEGTGSVFLSLSFLTRYNNVFLIPLILLKKNIKTIIYSLFVFSIVLIPWLLFNYISTGNPLASIADYYVLVSLQRLYYGNQLMQTVSIVLIGIFVILGLFYKEKITKLKILDISMVLLTLILILSFLNMPFKDIRYLYNFSLPAIYFFVKFFKKTERLLYLVVVINLISILVTLPLFFVNESLPYKNVYEENCMAMSNTWVYFNYYNIPTEPYPWKSLIGQYIDDGYRIILFKYAREPDYSNDEEFLSQFPIIENNTRYIILGNSSLCKEPYKIELSFKERKNQFLMHEYNYTVRRELGCDNNIFSKSICDILKI